MLMGLSAIALAPNTSHNPSGSVQEVAFAPVAFAPTLRGAPTGLRAHVGAPGSFGARATGARPAAFARMSATTAAAKKTDVVETAKDE